MIDLLKTLVAESSPSGFEKKSIDLFRNLISPFVDDVQEDVLGNLICIKKGVNASKKLMLIAHVDEVAMMVKYIEESGCLRVVNVGGLDCSLLKGLNVFIHHEGKIVRGVVGSCPVHFRRFNNDIDMSELWIDIGALNRTEAENLVSIGDFVSFDSPFYEFPNEIVTSKSCDDKVGLAVLIQVLTNLSSVCFDYDLVVVASVQEEVGARGAAVSSYSVSPDLCIAIDVTHATDYPAVNKSVFGDVRLGAGPTIPFGTELAVPVQDKLKQVAQESNFNYQIEVLPNNSGTDIHSVQVSRCGCLTGLICVPCRYMHTPVEMVSMNDLKIASSILTLFCKSDFMQKLK